MQRAFNSKFLVKLTRYTVAEGSYDDDNNWVEGYVTKSTIYGRIIAGNKFSQFEEGIARIVEDGGTRFADYRGLYVTNKYSIEPNDKIGYAGKYFNVLQQSDEAPFGFNSYILEKSENWKP
jgi:hypothetical protein